MSLFKYIARLQRMDFLIAMKATGPPEKFAYKMNLSRSTLFEMLQGRAELSLDLRKSTVNWIYYPIDERRSITRLHKHEYSQNLVI